MLGVDRRIGSAAQGSSFRLSAEISLCSACLLCLWDNFGVINTPFPPTDTFLCGSTVTFFVSSYNCHASSRQDRYPVATHCSDRPGKQSCQQGSGYCFTSGSAKIFALLFESAYKVGATCRAYHVWVSFCRQLEEKIHFLKHLWPFAI